MFAPPAIPIRHAVHRLSDPGEFSTAVSGGSLVADFFAKQGAPARIEQFQTPVWSLDFQETDVRAHIHCRLPEGWASVGLMRSPVTSSWYGWKASAGMLMCNPPGADIDGCIVPGFRCLTIGVPVSLWENCGRLAGLGSDEFGSVTAVHLPPDVHDHFERRLAGLVPLLRKAPVSPGILPAALGESTRLITDLITTAWELSRTTSAGPASHRNRTRLAHRAEEWMRGHLGEPVQVPEVCLALGVSRRELEYAFRLTFDQSPRDFLQSLRLNAIRRSIMGGPAGSLLDVAFDHGITHLGRFAENYRMLFGENPSSSRRRRVPGVERSSRG